MHEIYSKGRNDEEALCGMFRQTSFFPAKDAPQALTKTYHYLCKYIMKNKHHHHPSKKEKPHKPKLNQFHHIHETSIFTLRSSTTVSANPTTYMATATAFANAKISPIDPPNSGPRLLEIR